MACSLGSFTDSRRVSIPARAPAHHRDRPAALADTDVAGALWVELLEGLAPFAEMGANERLRPVRIPRIHKLRISESEFL